MELDSMFTTSTDTAKLDAALAKAQGEIEAASKDKVNPAFKSRYADLTSVWEACRPALAKHGISVTQWPVHSDDNRLHIVTRIAHGGEWIMARSSVPVTKQDPQGYGSAMTYAKRYALAAALGVVADEDDDGNAASEVREQPAKRPAPKKQPAAPAFERCTQNQAELIDRMIRTHVITDAERKPVLAKLSTGKLSKAKATECIEWLKAEIPARKAVEESERAEATA